MNFFKLTLLCLIFPIMAQAQNYPQRPIKLVVAYQAGGATDAFARIKTYFTYYFVFYTCIKSCSARSIFFSTL